MTVFVSLIVVDYLFVSQPFRNLRIWIFCGIQSVCVVCHLTASCRGSDSRIGGEVRRQCVKSVCNIDLYLGLRSRILVHAKRFRINIAICIGIVSSPEFSISIHVHGS